MPQSVAAKHQRELAKWLRAQFRHMSTRNESITAVERKIEGIIASLSTPPSRIGRRRKNRRARHPDRQAVMNSLNYLKSNVSKLLARVISMRQTLLLGDDSHAGKLNYNEVFVPTEETAADLFRQKREVIEEIDDCLCEIEKMLSNQYTRIRKAQSKSQFI